MRYRLPEWQGKSCLVYGRCSKDSQDASLADQYQVIQQCVHEAGLTPIREPFEDDGGRGHDEERPGLQEVIEYVRTHPNRARHNEDFIPILVYNVARFGRFDDSKKIFYYLVQIEKYGYEFYSVMEGLRSRGNIGEFVQLIIRGEQAYQYTLDLSEYGIRTGCSLAEKGWWPGGYAPYGFDRLTYGPDGKPRYRYVNRPNKTIEKYSLDGGLVESFPPINDQGRLRSAYSDKLKTDKVKLVPNAEHAKVVRMIFDWFVNEDWGLKRITSHLNKLGITPPRGRHWLKTGVRGILVNPAHKGAIAYGRRSDGKHHDVDFERLGDRYVPKMRRRDVAVQEIVRRPLDECVIFENAHEAIIPLELWNLAQRKFQLRRNGNLGHRGNGGRGSDYILSGDGLMKCARCGYRFHGSTDRKSNTRYYLDNGYHEGGPEVCEMTLVSADELEYLVLDWIRERSLLQYADLYQDKEQLVAEVEKTLDNSSLHSKVAHPKTDSLERKLAELRRKREEAERLEMEFGRGASQLVDRIRTEEAALAQELSRLLTRKGASLSEADRHRLAIDIAQYHTDLESAFRHGTPEERKRFIRDFIHSIEVDGRERKIKIAFYGDGNNSGVRVVPPTGFEPVSRT